jgi:hypothetical protein
LAWPPALATFQLGKASSARAKPAKETDIK